MYNMKKTSKGANLQVLYTTRSEKSSGVFSCREIHAYSINTWLLYNNIPRRQLLDSTSRRSLSRTQSTAVGGVTLDRLFLLVLFV